MQRLNKSTYSEQVVSLIRQRIRNGKLRGGDRISEASVAEECGISRAPVREALSQLETEGFLMSHPKRGKCVTVLSGDDIRHRYELCGLLEGAATAAVTLGRHEGLLEDLETLLERMRAGVAEGSSMEEHASLGSAFHEAILERASNPFLQGIARSSCRVISKYLMYQQWQNLYSTDELYQRHNAIFEAILAHEPRRIEEAVRLHYADSAERLALLCEGAKKPKQPRTSSRAHFPTE